MFEEPERSILYLALENFEKTHILTCLKRPSECETRKYIFSVKNKLQNLYGYKYRIDDEDEVISKPRNNKCEDCGELMYCTSCVPF
jgi:hypothetical protein